MRREPLKYTFVGVALLLAFIEIFLLVSGKRILMHEEFTPAREASVGSFYVPAEDAKFDCIYFTGRKRVYETLPSNQFDECPFIWTEG